MGERTIGNWAVKTAIEQIEKCAFECQGGPLENNDAWRWLKATLEAGPTLMPGQSVWYEVKAEALGVTMSKWTRFYVLSVRASSSSERREWEYDLITQLPEAYFTGGHVVKNAKLCDIKLSNPDSDKASPHV